MKKAFSIILLFVFSLSFAQMQTYKFENIIQYRIKSDFYSDFLNIYSTKDNAANLLITQTPMGNYASLKIGDNVYSVYSEEENNRVFKIDFEGTKDMLGSAFLNTDNPSLNIVNTSNSFIVKKIDKKETILDKKCDVYTITKKDDEQDKVTEICIDTNSSINTVPFINPELNLKGLIYRVDQNFILEKFGSLADVMKEELDEDEQKKAQEDAIFKFDEKTELENYKKQYNENKTKSNTQKNKK